MTKKNIFPKWWFNEMAMNPMVESKKSPNKQIEDNNNY